jgi:hypothetical protein
LPVPNRLMLRCEPKASLEARTLPELRRRGASFEAQPFVLRTSG